MEILRNINSLNPQVEAFRIMVAGYKQSEVEPEEFERISEAHISINELGHKILLQIKWLGEDNTFIDKTQFVFKGKDQMLVLRAVMANAKKVAAMFTLY